MMPTRPSPQNIGRARGAPGPAASPTTAGPPARAGIAARIGAPALIALGSALALLALVLCALVLPGFARPAGAETTTSTEVAPSAVPSEDPAAIAPSTTEMIPSDPTPAEPAPGRRLATLPWGNGAGQVGLARPQEGLTRGPEALAIAPDGRIAVLDSVNSRLVLLAADGSFMGSIPLALSEPRFLAVDDDAILVLDADVDRELVSLDWQGASSATIQIPVLEDVATGLFITADGPCIEVAHDDVFFVDAEAARDGKPSKGVLRAIAGRPVDRDLGKAVKASFKPKEGVKLTRYKIDKKSLKSTQTQTAAPKLAGKTLEHLVSVDSDGREGLIIGGRLLQSKADPEGPPALIVGRLAAGAGQDDPGATITDTLTLLDSPFAYLGQPYAVAPDGRIFQPVGSEQGFSVFVYTLPGDTSADSGAGSLSGAVSEGVQP